VGIDCDRVGAVHLGEGAVHGLAGEVLQSVADFGSAPRLAIGAVVGIAAAAILPLIRANFGL
jgi:hypothetical protein